MNKNKIIYIILSSIFTVFLMTYIEKIMTPTYWFKAVLKLIIFLFVILLYAFIFKDNVLDILYLKKVKFSKRFIIFLLFAYLIIIIGYLLFKNVIDLENIKYNLLIKEKIITSEHVTSINEGDMLTSD